MGTMWKSVNLLLTSFELHVQGVCNLVDVTLSLQCNAPPQILFTSSVSMLVNWKHNRRIPEVPFHDPTYAIGGGYGEVKWVSEHVCAALKSQNLMLNSWVKM